MGDFRRAFAAFESAATAVGRDFHGAVAFDTLNGLASRASGLMGSFSSFCVQGRAEADAQAQSLKKLFPKGLDGLDEEMRNFERRIGWNDRTGSFGTCNSPTISAYSRPSISSQTSSAAWSAVSRNATPQSGFSTSRMMPMPTRASPSPARTSLMPSSTPQKTTNQATTAIPQTYNAMATTHIHPATYSTTTTPMLDSVSRAMAEKYSKALDCRLKMRNAILACGKLLTLRKKIISDLDALHDLASERNTLPRATSGYQTIEARLLATTANLDAELKTLLQNDSWRSISISNLNTAEASLNPGGQTAGSLPSWAKEPQKRIETMSNALKAQAIRSRNLKSCLSAEKASCGGLRVVLEDLKRKMGRAKANEANGNALCRRAEQSWRLANPSTALRFLYGVAGGRWTASPAKLDFDREWRSLIDPHIRQIGDCAMKISNLQKRTDALSSSDINNTSALPSIVTVDSCNVSMCGCNMELPVSTPFPFNRPRYFKNSSEIEPFLLRLICALPVGSVRITIVDIEAKGNNGRVLNNLAKAGQDTFRLVTDIDDLHSVLKEHGSYIASLTSTGKFTATVGNWSAYNACHPRNPLPCRILAIHSLRGWDERDIDNLADLFGRGPDSGVHVLFSLEGNETLDERVRSKVKAWLAKTSTTPVDMVKWAGDGNAFIVTRNQMRLPSPSQVERLLDDYAALSSKRSASAEHVFADLFAGTPVWSASSINGLEAPIGWDESGYPVNLRIDDNNVHALIGGITGGGKSNLIHVILCSLCHRYSPDELQICLLDMKNGVEAFRYLDGSNAWLPHAKAILASKSPRFAKRFIEEMIAEMDQRTLMFQRDGATSIEEWRIKTHRKMPRIFFVVDEFTHMLKNPDLVKETAGKLEELLEQGRSFGLHVLLSTQDTDALTTSNASVILGQMRVRLALPDAPGVLASGNNADKALTKPQCILNEFKGEDGKNRLFVHPFFDNRTKSPGDVDIFHKSMDAAAVRFGKAMPPACKVINSIELRPLPPPIEFRSLLGPEPSGKALRFNLLLGREDSFEGAPFRIIFDGAYFKDHLLIASGKDRNNQCGIWDGLRTSVLGSLSALPDKGKRVLLYDPTRESHPYPKATHWLDFLGDGASTDEVKQKLEALRDSSAKHRVFVIENLESSKVLVSTDPYGMGGSSDPDTALGILCSAFTASKAFTVVVFTHDVAEVQARLGEKWGAFSHRIAFGYERPEDLRGIIKGADMLDHPGQSVFYSGPGVRGGYTTILPFVQPEGKP